MGRVIWRRTLLRACGKLQAVKYLDYDLPIHMDAKYGYCRKCSWSVYIGTGYEY